VLDDLGHFLEQSEAEPEVRQFARDLIQGCWSRRDELDGIIAAVAENWDVRRMAVVDRNVLRLASYELLFIDDVPPKVSINEAIDLAKRYSTIDSGGFVNGILDRIRVQAETQEAKPDTP